MEIVKTGIEKIVSRSKIFLQEIGEFAPFGIIYKDGKWIDIATYDQKQDSIKMRNFLINTVINDFQDENCLFGAVCIDAEIENIGKVMVIYNTSDGKEWYELIYKYSIEDNEVVIIEENLM